MESLSEQQIEDICQAIPINQSIPILIAESIVTNIRKKLKEDLKTVKLYPSLFETFKKEILKYYHKTLTQAGESVGIITAQSIGERQTQSTLNSVTYETLIIVRDVHGNVSKVQIGEFIENKIKTATKTQYENDTTYSELDDYYEIPSCDEDGNVSWKRIEAVTKHPVINPDGSNTMVKITTEGNRDVIATKTKSFLKLVNGKIVEVDGDSLQVGDYLPVSKKPIDFNKKNTLPDSFFEEYNIPRKEVRLDYDFGYLLGLYFNKIVRHHTVYTYFHPEIVTIFEKLCGNDFISDLILFSNRCCLSGFLDVCVEIGTKELVTDIQQMFNVFGIHSQIKKLGIEYTLDYTLQKDHIPDEINGNIVFRQRKNDYVDLIFDQITCIQEVENTTSYAYDLTVCDTKNFNLYNGLAMRDTFHSAGLTIKCVVTGVPRFSELLNATKEPKMVNCLIYLNQSFENIPEIRKTIGNSFTEITLKRIVTNYEFNKGPLEKWHHIFCEIYDIDKSKLGWRLRFFLDKNILYEYNIDMKLIKQQIEKNNPNMVVLYTPESKSIIDIFIEEFNEEEEEEEEEEEKEKEEEEEYDDDELEMNKEIERGKIDILREKHDIPYDIEQTIKIEDKILPLLLKLKISGISKIKEIFFEKRKKDQEEWVITTEGSNLYGLFSHPLVDKKRTLCNNMWEIYETFGIEATRQFLIEEYMDVVSSDGTFVNSSHVELLVDVMVYTGSIISISRYGQKKVGSGPLSKASFEESLENFLKAGLNGEKETTDGVSASIMLGKLPKIGTGVFDLKMDFSKEKAKSIFKTKDVIEKEPVPSKTFSNKNSLFS